MRRTVSVILALLALCSCQQAQLKRVRVAPEGVYVKLDTVKCLSHVSARNYVGTVEVGRQSVLSALHGGTLTELDVKQGDKVAKGRVIAKIESQSVLSSYNASKASLKQAQDGLERAEKMYASGSIPEVKMVEIRTQVEQARSAFNAASSALEDCVIRAPFAGQIAQLHVHAGEHVGMGSSIALLVDATDLEISFSVPETEVFGIEIGSVASVLFPSLGQSVPAVVKSRAVIGNRLSHAYSCTLELQSVPQGLLPGMVCRVSMEENSAPQIVVPATAVKLDNSGRYVWLADSRGVVSKRYIETGDFCGKGIIVCSGLEQGELLIVEGMSKVSSGMKVRTWR